LNLGSALASASTTQRVWVRIIELSLVQEKCLRSVKAQLRLSPANTFIVVESNFGHRTRQTWSLQNLDSHEASHPLCLTRRLAKQFATSGKCHDLLNCRIDIVATQLDVNE
jgi:hypothetical protein